MAFGQLHIENNFFPSSVIPICSHAWIFLSDQASIEALTLVLTTVLATYWREQILFLIIKPKHHSDNVIWKRLTRIVMSSSQHHTEPFKNQSYIWEHYSNVSSTLTIWYHDPVETVPVPERTALLVKNHFLISNLNILWCSFVLLPHLLLLGVEENIWRKTPWVPKLVSYRGQAIGASNSKWMSKLFSAGLFPKMIQFCSN